jgi:DNA invertase Pin-like site-specific DNA recombinase
MPSTNGHGPKRAILYARVSSDEQAKKGYSLPNQLRQLRRYAEEMGYEVLAETVDDGYQGDSLWRPGINRVRHVVEKGSVDFVLATERDRVARKRGYVFVLEEEFREHGCALRTLEDKDEDSAEQRLMRAIKDDFAEYEHAKIAHRTFSKKLEKARSGEIIAGKTPNYGFRYNEKRNGYLIDQDKMPLVRRVFEMIGGEVQTSYSVVRWLEGADPHGPTGRRFWELSGRIVRCAECGYVMETTSSGTPTNDYYYYRCRSRYNVKSDCDNGRGVRADALEREAWKAISSALRRPARLRAGLNKMIESERRNLATRPEKEIAHWSTQIEKAQIKRSRYQDQEAENLMTRDELRVKLAELDQGVRMAEAEIQKLWRREEDIRALESSGEELLERYAELVPRELEELSPMKKRHIYQLLRVEVWVPKEGEIRLKLPFLLDGAEFCREETAS